MIYLVLLLIILLIYLIYVNKFHIDIFSFFKKGFQKRDDKFGLYTYTGVQGNGKTYSAVKFCKKMKLKNNYIIVTNVHSFNCFSDTIFIDNIIELINFVKINHDKNGKKYLIFFDEIFSVLMKGQKINIEILSFLAQLRKRGIIFVTTAQSWAEIPLTFRRFCRFQISCNMFNFFNLFAILYNVISDGYNIKWDENEQDFVGEIIQTNLSKGNLEIINSYDTFETIKSQNEIAEKKTRKS